MGVVGGGPRGGWPATIVRSVWCQALFLPRLPVLSGRQPGFRDPCVPGAVGAGVGTQDRPHSVRPCGPALRAVGVAEGRPRGGVPSAVVRGVQGQALPLPRLPAFRVGCRGPLPTGCGCGGVRAWGPVTNPTARASASCPCTLWGRHEGARRGRLLPGCGASGVGRSPTPDCPPSVRAAGAHCPLAVGAGGCRRGDPSSTPQRALLRAGLRAVGAARGRPGGAPPAWVWGVRGRALSHPRLPALWVGCRGPLPTGCGCGGMRAWGPVTNPTARALACWGGGMRVPGAGSSCLGVGRPGSGRSPTPDCPPSWRAAGAHYPLAVGAGGCGRGDPSPTPQRALLRAGFVRCGGGMRVPGEGASCLGVGRPGSGALPPPTARPLGGRPGPTTHLLWMRGARAWGPVTNPTARALASWLCALWGRHEGARGGAPPAWVWGVRGRALSHPRLPALPAGCRGPLPTCCGCGGAWAWGPVTNSKAPTLARCGGGMRVPGRGASCLGVGRPGSGALPPPTARPLGGLPGSTTGNEDWEAQEKARVAMDFVSLPEDKHPETGVKVDYVMVIVCPLTGHILDIPCRQDRLASHKAAALFLHYCVFSTRMPRGIHSDNQSIISSEFYDALYGLAGITQAKSIVYGPQSNGRAERAVQSIINALRLYLVFCKLDWIYALQFALWGLNDLPGPIAPYSPHRLAFGRDPMGFGEVPALTMDTGVEDATEYFRRAQDERQLIHPTLVDLHPREYQAFLKNHLSLQFKGGDRVWVQNRTDQPGLHPKLDRIWQVPAEILCKVSTNTYSVNLTGKVVILSVGRLNPYIPRRDGVKPPPIIALSVGTSTSTPMLSSTSWTMSIGVRFEGKRRSLNSPSKAANVGGKSNIGVLTGPNGMMSLLSRMTPKNTGWTTISGTTSRCPLIPSGKSSCGWTD